MDKKVYKDVEEMINYLSTTKSVVFSDGDKEWFSKRNYVSIINPYKKLFASDKYKNGEHIYPHKVPFALYKDLMVVDELISNRFHLYIGNFERRLKNILVRVICEEMQNMQDINCESYLDEFKRIVSINNHTSVNILFGFLELDKSIIDTKIVRDTYKIQPRLNLLKQIIEVGSAQIKSHNTLIRHYQLKGDVIPFWLICEILSFGDLCILFDMMDYPLRSKVILYFGLKVNNYNCRQFGKTLEFIRRLRNVINHYEPLFSFVIASQKGQIQNAIKYLNPKKQHGNYLNIAIINKYRNSYNDKYHLGLEEMLTM